MPVELIQLFIQIPIVAAFIWYSLSMQDRYQKSMDKRDDQAAKRDQAYLATLAQISSSVQILDMDNKNAHARLLDKLCERDRQKETA